MARVRKAIAGLVTPVVAYVVVKWLNGDDATARDVAGVVTGAIVYIVRNAV